MMNKYVNGKLIKLAATEVEQFNAQNEIYDAGKGEKASKEIRNHRDGLLQSTDWQALSDNTMSEAMTAYRKALRAVPDQDGFPFDVVWPDPPS
jgi:hypothetical protein